MKIKYTGRVFNRMVGFMTVTFTAYADAISTKRCRVTEVLEIDGKAIIITNPKWAASQIGKTKNLASCEVVQS